MRPSAKSTHMQSSSNRTPLGEMVIPCSFKFVPIGLDQPLGLVQGLSSEAVIYAKETFGVSQNFASSAPCRTWI